MPWDFDRGATLGQGHCAEHCDGPGFAGLSVPWELLEKQLTAELRQRLNEAAHVSSDDFGFALSEC